MTFKLNSQRIIETFWVGALAIVMCWGFMIRLVLMKYGVIEMRYANPDRMNTGIFVYFIATTILWLPSLICFIQYLKYSKNIELNLDANTKLMAIKTAKQTVNINYSEIEMIKKVCSNAIAQKRAKLYADDPFYYYKIITSKGDKFIIPCLVIGDELAELYPDKIRVFPKFTAFISE